MTIRRFVGIVGVVFVIAASLGMSACAQSSDSGSTAASSATPSLEPGVVAPQVVAIKNLPGATITMAVGDFLDINVEGSNEAAWSAILVRSGVAEFIPGGPNGGAIDNPGFAAVGVGHTTVEMTDGTTIVEFEISVLANNSSSTQQP